jgi:predicted amidophosphoribosyltransferase
VQRSVAPTQRRANVRGCFRILPLWRETLLGLPISRLSGRRIVLVDDVTTTRSTLFECARTLRRAGADAQITAAVLAVAGPLPAH